MTETLRHVGEVLLGPLTDPDSRTWLPALGVTALVALVWHLGRTRGAGGWRGLVHGVLAPHLWVHRSSRLDLQIVVARRLVMAMETTTGLGLTFVFATGLVRALDRWIGVPVAPDVPLPLLSAAYTVLLFVGWDLSRYALHRWMHTVPLLWEFHQVHHSAEVLTPLTFHRVHPVESALYQLRGILVGGVMAGLVYWVWRGAAVEWTVFGVHAVGLVLNAVTGNLRHSHVWLRFGATVEGWLLSPAQHQMHHAADLHGVNYGTWLACWDRMSGSLRVAGPEAPRAFGLPEGERNHGDDLISAMIGPFVSAGGRVGRRVRPVVALLSAVGGVARAADPEPPEDEDTDPAYEILVVRPDGTPRVAGSAHVITEEELERWGYDDIGKSLAKVPGVYVRGEDGFGLRPNIGMRGGSSDRSAKIALMEDGVSLAPAPYAAPAAYYFPLANRFVGIEVFKGPASIRYGPQTIGGAVNVLTRPIPDSPSGTLDVAAGLRSTIELHGYTGTGNRNVGFLIEGAHLSTGGFKELDTGGPTGFERQDLMLKLRAGAPRNRFDLKLGYGRERSDETYLGLSAEDFAETPYRRYAASDEDHMVWHHTEEELGWRLALGQRVDLRTTLYHHYLTRAWTKLNRFADGPDLHDLLQLDAGGQSAVYLAILRGEEDSTGPGQELLIGTNDRTFHNVGAQTAATWRAGGPDVGSELTVGFRVHADDVLRLHTEDPFRMVSGRPVPTGGATTTILDAHTSALAFAGYVAEDLKLGAFHVLPGARMEAIRTAAGTAKSGPVDPQHQTIVLPGLGALVAVRPWLDVFGGVHRGFSPIVPGSNPNVAPETAWNTELGFRAIGGQTHAEIVGFFSDYDNLTGQCTLSGGCVESQLDQQFNGGRAWVYGVETLASHRLLLPERVTVDLSAGWTYTGTEFRTGFSSEYPQWGQVEIGDALPYVPTHQGSATVAAEHPRGGLALTATGRSALRDTAGQGPDDLGLIPGSLILDLAGHVQVTPHVRGLFTVTNLTDAVVLESWRPYGARPGAPLQVTIGVRAGS